MSGFKPRLHESLPRHFRAAEAETGPHRGGVNGYDVVGIANVPSAADHIGHDGRQPLQPRKPRRLAFPDPHTSPPVERQDEHYIWPDWLAANLLVGCVFSACNYPE